MYIARLGSSWETRALRARHLPSECQGNPVIEILSGHDTRGYVSQNEFHGVQTQSSKTNGFARLDSHQLRKGFLDLGFGLQNGLDWGPSKHLLVPDASTGELVGHCGRTGIRA